MKTIQEADAINRIKLLEEQLAASMWDAKELCAQRNKLSSFVTENHGHTKTMGVIYGPLQDTMEEVQAPEKPKAKATPLRHKRCPKCQRSRYGRKRVCECGFDFIANPILRTERFATVEGAELAIDWMLKELISLNPSGEEHYRRVAHATKAASEFQPICWPVSFQGKRKRKTS